jgi:hypothetical protein
MKLISAFAGVSAVAMAVSIANAQSQPPIPEASGNVIGYSTVSDALHSLKKRSDVSISQQRGWTVIEDEKDHSVWSFPPPSDPSYPSAIRRSVTNENGAAYVHSDIHCEASKAACDNLVRQFEELDHQMRSALSGRS